MIYAKILCASYADKKFGRESNMGVKEYRKVYGLLLILVCSICSACSDESTENPASISTESVNSNRVQGVESIEYLEIEVETKNEINSNNQGILIDLNGDQVKEKVYADKRGLNINGVWYYNEISWNDPGPTTPWNKYWILDIDTTDSYKEILLEEKSDGGEILCIFNTELEIVNRVNYGNLTGIEYATIVGDGTVTIPDTRINALINYQSDIKCKLNQDHGLSLVEDSYPVNDIYELQLLKEITLYEAKDKRSERITIIPQTVVVVETDGNHWVQIKADDQTEGWLYYEYKVEEGKGIVNESYDVNEFFSGFSTAG